MLIAREIRILLVEDSPSDAELAMRAFANSSFKNTVSHARDGVEALEMLRREGRFLNCPRPDLIFLDLNMPRKDGRQVLAEIRQDADLSSIPVIVMTTSSEDADVVDCYRLGTNSYLVKPVELPEFFALIEDAQKYWCTTSLLPARLH